VKVKKIDLGYPGKGWDYSLKQSITTSYHTFPNSLFSHPFIQCCVI